MDAPRGRRAAPLCGHVSPCVCGFTQNKTRPVPFSLRFLPIFFLYSPLLFFSTVHEARFGSMAAFTPNLNGLMNKLYLLAQLG
ncbi:MAG: hypothetical protein PHY12_00980 [Eubacteriales bacterium]|nr:hypothetical protein [Eubacteriales bacterium]